MEKLNFVQNGARKLPLGFRFQPTDEEIVFQYLKHKTFSLPLSASVVSEISIYNYDPWDFPGDGDQEDRYFFTKKESKYQNGSRSNRATRSGYWKATGSDKRITCPKKYSKDDDDQMIMGMRKTLVFHRGKPPNGSRSDWIMHEYRLVNSGPTTCNNSTKNNNLVQMGDWFLCRIFLKKGSTEKQDEEIIQPRVYGFTNGRELDEDRVGPSSSSASSCGSSAITHDVTSNGFDREETSCIQWF